MAKSGQLRMAELIDDAYRLARPRANGPWQFLDGLEALVAALNDEADLSPAGRKITRDALVRSLVTQLAVRDLVAAHPDILTVMVRRPVIITCLPRMGSTWLHGLLATHPDLRAPRMWEVMAPHASYLGGMAREAAIADASAAVTEYFALAPSMYAMHPTSPDHPEECHRLLAHTFRTRAHESRFHIPSYQRWLRTADMTAAYAYHRLLVQCLVAAPSRRRLILKCPYHLWHLAELFATYPDARLVHLHRDPVAALRSACTMMEAAQRVRSDHVNLIELGRYWSQFYAEGTRLAVDRAAADATGPAVLDVRYEDLVAEPRTTLARIGEFADLELPAELIELAAEQTAAHRRTSSYQSLAPKYGIDLAEFEAAVAPYRARFRV
jgi:hypothetical protein